MTSIPRPVRIAGLTLAFLLAAAGPAEGLGHPRLPRVQEGPASFYGLRDGSGPVTANGERFHPHGLTAAHATLPFGTTVRITVLDTGRSVVARVNDRTGPAVARYGRIIDVSHGTAAHLGILQQGIARVRVEPLHVPEPGAGRRR